MSGLFAVPENMIDPPIPTLFPFIDGVCELHVGGWFFVMLQVRVVVVKPLLAVAVKVLAAKLETCAELKVRACPVAPTMGLPSIAHVTAHEESFVVAKKFIVAEGDAEIFKLLLEGDAEINWQAGAT